MVERKYCLCLLLFFYFYIASFCIDVWKYFYGHTYGDDFIFCFWGNFLEGITCANERSFPTGIHTFLPLTFISQVHKTGVVSTNNANDTL